MTSSSSTGPDPRLAHPPLLPGQLPAPRTVWPTVLGIIGIVFGSLGALAGAWGTIAPVLMENIPFFRTAGFDPFAGVRDWRTELVVINLVTALLGVQLAIGAYMLMKRKPAARATLLLWALAKCVIVVAASYVGYQINQAQWASMRASGVGPPVMSGFMTFGSIVGVVFGIGWGWALPAFIVGWFMRPAINHEVATWGGPPR